MTAIVSAVAAHADVRAAMVRAQRAHRARRAGRDGRTRYRHGRVAGRAGQDLSHRFGRGAHRAPARCSSSGPASTSTRGGSREEIEERDRLDRTRAISPLAPAPDAHVIDSSEIDADDVVDEICAIVVRRDAASR